MTTIEEAGHVVGPAPGFFDRDRIVAGPRFNRWLVPPAALAIHLCIGMAYGFSVFWLPMTRLIARRRAACQAGFIAELSRRRCNWTVPTVTHIFETFIAVLGHLGGDLGRLAGARRPAQGGLHRRAVLGRRPGARRARRARSTSSGWSIWLRRDRRRRPGARLHHPGLDPDQMVSRPARHGHGLCHHGLWRRRDDRLAAGGLADGALRPATARPASPRR